MKDEGNGDELGVAGRRRLTRQLLVGVPLVVGLAVFAAKGPVWLVDRGEEAMDKCLDAAKTGGDPARCATGPGFAIGRLFPEVRAHANDVERKLQQRRAILVFDRVMASKPNAARRDSAAAQLVADAPDRADAADHAARAGAFAPMAAGGFPPDAFYDRFVPAFAAITIGDIAAARASVARQAPRDFDGAAPSAALACLLGDRVRGPALLRAAAARREHDSGMPSAPVRFAAQHCGGSVDSLGFDPHVVGSTYALEGMAARLFDPQIQVGRRAAIGATLLRDTTIFRAGRIAAFALSANGVQEPSPLALLGALAAPGGREVDLQRAFGATPWELPSDDVFVDYVPPDWLELAAARYAHAAQVAPERVSDEQLSRSFNGTPRETLRAAAELAYEFAAGYRLRRADRAGARRALEQWRSLAPTDFRRAPLELAVGDPARALATVDAWQAAQRGTPDADLEQFVALSRVLALAATGRHAEAHAIAKRLAGRAGEWLLLATAIASGGPLKQIQLETDRSADTITPQAVLAAIQAKRPIHDFIYLDSDDRAVLPAIMVAVARAAQVAGEDPEVALDQAFARYMPSRTVALSRAEAARWRSDTVAAQLWERRAEVIEKLFVDDHAVVLAGVAGLW